MDKYDYLKFRWRKQIFCLHFIFLSDFVILVTDFFMSSGSFYQSVCNSISWITSYSKIFFVFFFRSVNYLFICSINFCVRIFAGSSQSFFCSVMLYFMCQCISNFWWLRFVWPIWILTNKEISFSSLVLWLFLIVPKSLVI